MPCVSTIAMAQSVKCFVSKAGQRGGVLRKLLNIQGFLKFPANLDLYPKGQF